MTNAQAGLIAAAIMCAPHDDKESIKHLAVFYSSLLDSMDHIDLWGE